MKNEKEVPMSWLISKISYDFERIIFISSLFIVPFSLSSIYYLKNKIRGKL